MGKLQLHLFTPQERQDIDYIHLAIHNLLDAYYAGILFLLQLSRGRPPGEICRGTPTTISVKATETTRQSPTGEITGDTASHWVGLHYGPNADPPNPTVSGYKDPTSNA